MQDQGGQTDKADLKLIFTTLEAEYRIYRRAAERYHDRVEQGFEMARQVPKPPEDDGQSETERTLRTLPNGAPLALLTGRETQVLCLIASGYSTKQVASALGIKFKTAVGHRSQLMKKLAIHDTASLVRFAIRMGLIEA